MLTSSPLERFSAPYQAPLQLWVGVRDWTASIRDLRLCKHASICPLRLLDSTHWLDVHALYLSGNVYSAEGQQGTVAVWLVHGLVKVHGLVTWLESSAPRPRLTTELTLITLHQLPQALEAPVPS